MSNRAVSTITITVSHDADIKGAELADKLTDSLFENFERVHETDSHVETEEVAGDAN